MHPVLSDLEPLLVDQLIGDEPVAELRVVRMHVHGSVDGVLVVPVPRGHRLVTLGVVCRRGEDDTRHNAVTWIPSPAGSPTKGQIILGSLPSQLHRRPTQDLVLML